MKGSASTISASIINDIDEDHGRNQQFIHAANIIALRQPFTIQSVQIHTNTLRYTNVSASRQLAARGCGISSASSPVWNRRAHFSWHTPFQNCVVVSGSALLDAGHTRLDPEGGATGGAAMQ